MEKKLEKLIDDLRKAAKEEIELSYKEKDKTHVKFYQGRSNGFALSAQWLSDILNSENPNSVSNQPTEE